MHGQEPPACPPDSSLEYPSVVFEYLLLTLMSLVLCLFVAIKYNHVMVFDRKFYSKTVSNTLWVSFFLFTAIRAGGVCIRYLVDPTASLAYYEGFILVAHNTSVLSLTFALDHQLKFRTNTNDEQQRQQSQRKTARRDRSDIAVSGPTQPLAPSLLPTLEAYGRNLYGTDEASTSSSYQSIEGPHTGPYVAAKFHDSVPEMGAPSLSNNVPGVSSMDHGPELRSIYLKSHWFGWLEGALALLYVVAVTCSILTVAFESVVLRDLYAAVYVVQQVPVILFVVYLVVQPTEAGLSLKSKLLLVAAELCNLSDELPLSGWSEAFYPSGHTKCISWLGNFVSWVDLIHILTFAALLLFFLFVRNEYIRFSESFIWRTNPAEQEAHYSYQRFLEDHSSTSPPSSLSTSLRTSGVLY